LKGKNKRFKLSVLSYDKYWEFTMNVTQDKGLQDYRKQVKVWQAELDQRIEKAKFSEKGEHYLNGLIDDSFLEVKRYSTKELAGIFSGCIDWTGTTSRQDTDWAFAKDCIEKYLGESGIRRSSERVIILGAYETLPPETIAHISGNNAQLPRDNLYVMDHAGIFLWLPYREQMQKLSDDQLISHLQQGKDNLSDNLDIFLKKPVWEIYQNVKRNPDKFPTGYGQITYH
jgi:hypothetical protein